VGAVLLVGRQRREGEHRNRDVVRSLVRKKIAVMRAAELVDQRNPHPAVDLELLHLERVDFVAKIAGDHGLLRAAIVLLSTVPASHIVIARSVSDEAIHGATSGQLDCFASLAMTADCVRRGCRYLLSACSSRASRLDVSQRLPPIFSTSE